MKTRNIIILFSLLIILVGFGLAKIKNGVGVNPEMDKFATCITDSGTKFFGAWWCPHCLTQKALFGKSVNKLPYVECSDTNKKQLPICDEAKITKGYPTWRFPDGTDLNGEVSLDILSKKTSCPLPLNLK